MSNARIIATNIKDETGHYIKILKELQTQLSDGYWEGEYDDDEFITSFWAFLDFYLDYDDTLIVSVSTEQEDELNGANYFYDVDDVCVLSDVGLILRKFYKMRPDAVTSLGFSKCTGEEVESLILMLLGNFEVASCSPEDGNKIAELEALLKKLRESVRDTVGGKPLKEVDKILRESGYTF